MRIMLTEKREYHLSPDIELCNTLEEVYMIVGTKEPKDEVLHIFVDLVFNSVSTLRQIEMFKNLVKDFKIIVDTNIKATLNLNKELSTDLYYTVKVTKTATDLFMTAQPLMDKSLSDLKTDYKRLVDNPSLMQTMINYDILNLQNLLNSMYNTLENMEQSQMGINSELSRLVEENTLIKENLTIARERNKEIEENRKELLSSNLLLKYNGYLDEVARPTTEITTPVLYIKAPLMKESINVTNTVRVLKDLMINKYGKNVMLIVIEDPNTLRIKKINDKFTYIESSGSYNMDLGTQVITTPNYNHELMKSYEEFAGVKDLFLILDITPTPNIFTIGEGNIAFITNKNQRENLELKNIEGVVLIEEDDLLDTYEGEDEFNLELNIARSKHFIKLEEMAARISI